MAISHSSSASSEASSTLVIELNNVIDEREETTASIDTSPIQSTITPEVHAPVSTYPRDRNRTKWEEAALYVQEGIDNDKFFSHPNGVLSKVAFNIVHNPLFYIMEFTVCCLLMGLAIIEEPALVAIRADDQTIVIVIHSVLEMFLLSVIALNILLRFIWMKPKTFLYQRTTLAAIIMVVMFIEAMVVLIRRDSHFRVTRCLRPVFFIDSYLMIGVRRVLRQLFQCLKPITDVMLMLFLMVAVFSLAGYYLFADIDPTFFDTYLKSFLSLFIALTTANHPDVFMEAYVRNRATPLFFILYLFVTLFFFSNVLLGVVYTHFSKVDKNKFKKLFLHKREALQLAFSVLDEDGQGISFHNFLLFMLEHKPRISEYHVLCIFKALQNSSQWQEYLHLEDFLKFYEVQSLQWKQVKEDGKAITWYEDFPPQVQPFFVFLHKIERLKCFDTVMALVVILNAMFLILYTLITSFYCGSDGAENVDEFRSIKKKLLKYCESNRFIASHDALVGSFIFTGIYMIEISIRMLAVGPVEYFKKRWNRYDFGVILLSFLLLCVEADAGSNEVLSYLVIFRPVKLLRLIKLKKRYYSIMRIIPYLGDRLVSIVLLLVVIFYFYAIIGMEVFQGAVYVGCCESAIFGVSSYYQANVTEYSIDSYWINNFDNIYQSYVLLYEEMVVNNWFIQMEGFVSETNIYSRIFFFSFWMTITVCLSVAIAYIVDAFVFSMQTSQERSKCNKHRIFKCGCNQFRHKEMVEITLSSEEIEMLKHELVVFEKSRKWFSLSYMVRLIKRGFVAPSTNDQFRFRGKVLKTKDNLNLEKYKNELQGWIEEREERIKYNLRHSRNKTLIENVWEKLKAVLLFLLE